MPSSLNIKDPETCALARRLARQTGETLTIAVKVALMERLERYERRAMRDLRLEKLMEIAERCSNRPVLDATPPDEILGYNDRGLFD